MRNKPEELKSREALDFELLSEEGVLSGIDLGDLDGRVLQGLGELLPDWGKMLAVTAPWSVEFDKDELVALDEVMESREVEVDDGRGSRGASSILIASFVSVIVAVAVCVSVTVSMVMVVVVRQHDAEAGQQHRKD